MTCSLTTAHENALQSLLDVCHRYRTVLTTLQHKSSSGGALWTPIYADLLEDLMGEVRTAAQLYDRAANDAGIEECDRISWRKLLDANESV